LSNTLLDMTFRDLIETRRRRIDDELADVRRRLGSA
jgi:hypothetical protein